MERNSSSHAATAARGSLFLLLLCGCGGGSPAGPSASPSAATQIQSGLTYRVLDIRSDQPPPGATILLGGRGAVSLDQNGEARFTDASAGTKVDFSAPGFITRKETVTSATGTFTILLIPVAEDFLRAAWFDAANSNPRSYTITMVGPTCLALSPELSGDPGAAAAHQEAVNRLNEIIRNDGKRIAIVSGGSCTGTLINAVIEPTMKPGDWYGTYNYQPQNNYAIYRGWLYYGSSLEAARQVNLVMSALARAMGACQPRRPGLLESFYASRFQDFTVEEKAVIRGLLDRGPGNVPPDNSASRAGE